MSELVFKGNQIFMGREIPVIYGGFGETQKCISDKTVAELHSTEIRWVRRRITDNNEKG